MSSIVLLVITKVTGLIGDSAKHPTSNQLIEYFGAIAVILVLAIFAFLYLMNSEVFSSILKEVEFDFAAFARKEREKKQSLNPDDYDNDELVQLEGSIRSLTAQNQNSDELPFSQLFTLLRIPILSMIFNMFSTVLILTFFSYGKSSPFFYAKIVEIVFFFQKYHLRILRPPFRKF